MEVTVRDSHADVRLEYNKAKQAVTASIDEQLDVVSRSRTHETLLRRLLLNSLRTFICQLKWQRPWRF
jgi:hypothetical protein